MFMYGENSILGYESDGFSIHELFRGLRPWHDAGKFYQELGRSRDAYPLLKEVAVWYKRVVIFVTKLLKAVRVREREGTLEV